MNSIRYLAAAFCFLAWSPTALANGDIIFSPNFLYYSWNETLEGVTDSELTGTYMDFKLGWKLTPNVYLGGIYSTMTRDYGTSERTRTGMGVSAGLMSGNLFLIGHYYLSLEYSRSDTDTLQEGSGLQVDFGYYFSVANNFYIGPQVTHRNFSYDERAQGSGSTTALTDTKHSETLPYVAFAFIF